MKSESFYTRKATLGLIGGSVLSALSLLAPGSATAQIDPVCREVAADADGDGFGWQDGASCIVTQESLPAPVITNLETNAYVELTRAYWNPPTDLYNKTITCVAHYFNNNAGAYIADNDPSRETHYSFHYTHFPLTTSPPYIGTVRSEHIVAPGPGNDSFETYYDVSLVNWSMDNGIYTGGAPFTDSPYVELITEESTNQKAIRTWTSNRRFVRCTAAPTGIPPSSDNATTEAESTTTGDTDNSDQTNDAQTDPTETNETDSTGITDNSDSLLANDTSDTADEMSASSGGGSMSLYFILMLGVVRRIAVHKKAAFT